jgi:hypothetical protein
VQKQQGEKLYVDANSQPPQQQPSTGITGTYGIQAAIPGRMVSMTEMYIRVLLVGSLTRRKKNESKKSNRYRQPYDRSILLRCYFLRYERIFPFISIHPPIFFVGSTIYYTQPCLINKIIYTENQHPKQYESFLPPTVCSLGSSTCAPTPRLWWCREQ